MQWLGSPAALEDALQKIQFAPTHKWTWRDAFFYINTSADLSAMPPRPALHEGLKAKITASLPVDPVGHFRLTARAFRVNAVVEGQSKEPVFVVSLTHEILKRHFQLVAVPSDQPATLDETQGLHSQTRSRSQCGED